MGNLSAKARGGVRMNFKYKQNNKVLCDSKILIRRLLLLTMAQFAAALLSIQPLQAEDGFLSDRLFLTPVCPIGADTRTNADGERFIGGALLGIGRVIAPRIFNRALRGAADGLRRVGGANIEDRQKIVSAENSFPFYKIGYDEDEKKVASYLNNETRCLVFIRGKFGGGSSAANFGSLAAISKQFGRHGPAMVIDINTEDEFVTDYADEKNIDSANEAHKAFFKDKFKLIDNPQLYFEIALTPGRKGEFDLLPQVLWYTEKMGKRRDSTRDLLFVIQFDDLEDKDEATPDTFANATIKFEQMKVGTLLSPAAFQGFAAKSLSLYGLPSDLSNKSEWAGKLGALTAKLNAARAEIDTAQKAKIILEKSFDQEPAECAADAGGQACLNAKKRLLEAKVAWINAEIDEDVLPDCGGSDATEKKNCELIRDKYAAGRTGEAVTGQIAQLKLADLEAAVKEAKKGFDFVGHTLVKMDVTETSDANKLLLAIADIISPAENLTGLSSQQVSDIQTAIIAIPSVETDNQRQTRQTERQTSNQEYRLALLAIEQNERSLKEARDAGRPSSDWKTFEDEILRQQLNANIAASKLGIPLPFPKIQPGG